VVESADFFRKFQTPADQAIADLCEYIESRPIRSGVHGWQSHRNLCIAQRPVSYPYDGPYLLIFGHEADSTVEFRLVDTHVEERQWSRRDPADSIIHRFKHTMRQLDWFTEPAGLD
jgi:hypothetical protein